MPISLSKGSNMSLSKEAPGLTAVTVGLGWDARTTDGQPFDLDASAIVVGGDGRVLSDGHFVFFNQLASSDGSVRHQGDNRTGQGDGDDEKIDIDLSALPAAADRVVFAVAIHEADERRQSFGQVRSAFMRVVDRTSAAELGRYDLSEDSATETAMVFGEVYRSGSDWKFRAVGQGYASGLRGIAAEYGVGV